MKSFFVIAILVGVASALPAINQSICGKTDVGTRVHSDCRKYYVCSNGYATEMTCGQLFFNGNFCDYPENVRECNPDGTRIGGEPQEPVPEPEPQPEVPKPEPEPQPEVPKPEPELQPEVPQPEPEPQPEVPQPEPEPSPVNPGTGKCPNLPYYYLATSNPNRFEICLYGQNKGESNCSLGLVFNEAKQACVP